MSPLSTVVVHYRSDCLAECLFRQNIRKMDQKIHTVLSIVVLIIVVITIEVLTVVLINVEILSIVV